MKRLAILFAVAVVTPSLVLAWLALRSLNDQQFIVERQQSLLCQGVADALARDAAVLVEERQREFATHVESLLAATNASALAPQFDDRLRALWPAAQIGFVVSLGGQVFCPEPTTRPEARQFRAENDQFLCNRMSAEVYWGLGAGKGFANERGYNASPSVGIGSVNSGTLNLNANNARTVNNGSQLFAANSAQQTLTLNGNATFVPNSVGTITATLGNGNAINVASNSSWNYKQRQVVPQSQSITPPNFNYDANQPTVTPVVLGGGNNAITFNGAPINNGAVVFTNGAAIINAQVPQNALTLNGGVPAVANNANPVALNANNAGQQAFISQGAQQGDNNATVQNLSKVASTEAEFRQLVGDATEGTVARFLQNRLNLMLWYRPPRAPQLVFGALLDLAALRAELKNLVRVEPALEPDLAVALLDENAKPVAVSPAGFTAAWKRPFVATEIGEALPHWEMAVYLRDPGKLGLVTRSARLTLGLLVAVLLVAITAGSWLIVADVRRQLALARLKTDFVSNVSHELKTPLTSIRMFSELLAEGRAAPDKHRHYLGIITAEAARLTRLINNVLDFAKLDRGEKRFDPQPCDLGALAAETVGGYRAHLESAGFTLDFTPPSGPVPVLADRDALAQVVVNLLSNAEKYSNGSRTVSVTLATRNGAGNGMERGLQPASTSGDDGALKRPEGRAPAVFAELSVLDRGPGVPRGCEEKIFEQFFRAHDSLGSGIQGSGLGLTLARQIARAHGGDVTYAPREGGGSCFTLTLPITDGATVPKS
ncbi:MAG: HAMP domain-containing histidine kinase [Verrucomicrobia bacterium]|nr:HAMP domain-containing histidine kinase [Verrucomicrobiota bacterium]